MSQIESKDIAALVTQLKEGKRPLDHFLARSLEELYLSPFLLTGGIDPAMIDSESQQDISSVHLVALRNGEFDSATVSLSDKYEEPAETVMIINENWAKLPYQHSYERFVTSARNVLLGRGLQTAAALQISHYRDSEERLISLRFPNCFIQSVPWEAAHRLMPGNEALYRTEFAFNLSSHILKRQPPPELAFQIHLPSQ
jgi:hypothetical protein